MGQLTHGKVSRSTVAKAAGEAPIVVTRAAFDDHGNVIATIDPLGTPDGDTHRREYTYDAEGLRVVGTDILLEDPAGARRMAGIPVLFPRGSVELLTKPSGSTTENEGIRQ